MNLIRDSFKPDNDKGGGQRDQCIPMSLLMHLEDKKGFTLRGSHVQNRKMAEVF
jgi:hypothetical protein